MIIVFEIPITKSKEKKKWGRCDNTYFGESQKCLLECIFWASRHNKCFGGFLMAYTIEEGRAATPASESPH
jgi:hypothetical protein